MQRWDILIAAICSAIKFTLISIAILYGSAVSRFGSESVSCSRDDP